MEIEVELPPEHSGLFEYMDARVGWSFGQNMFLCLLSQIHFFYPCLCFKKGAVFTALWSLPLVTQLLNMTISCF